MVDPLSGVGHFYGNPAADASLEDDEGEDDYGEDEEEVEFELGDEDEDEALQPPSLMGAVAPRPAANVSKAGDGSNGVILDHRKRGRGMQYLVRMRGVEKWLSGTAMVGQGEMIRAYEAAAASPGAVGPSALEGAAGRLKKRGRQDEGPPPEMGRAHGDDAEEEGDMGVVNQTLSTASTGLPLAAAKVGRWEAPFHTWGADEVDGADDEVVSADDGEIGTEEELEEEELEEDSGWVDIAMG